MKRRVRRTVLRVKRSDDSVDKNYDLNQTSDSNFFVLLHKYENDYKIYDREYSFDIKNL